MGARKDELPHVDENVDRSPNMTTFELPRVRGTTCREEIEQMSSTELEGRRMLFCEEVKSTQSLRWGVSGPLGESLRWGASHPLGESRSRLT